MKNLDNYSLNEKKVILRTDFNVPVFNGKITDLSRIEAVKKTIKKLKDQKNKIFIISHFGRPQGKNIKKYSLEFLCPTLENEFKTKKIFFLNIFTDEKINEMINLMNPGDICLLENIRFYPEEEKNDLDFIRNFSKNFDAYVNDAFSASHRNHASIVNITKCLPSVAGYGLIEEIKSLNYFVNSNKKPRIGIIGGSKVSTKMNLLINLIENLDVIIIGGAMANTFLLSQKIEVGNSLYEKHHIDTAQLILDKSKKYNCKIILPIDVICADHLNDKKNIRECEINNILSNQMILDIGKKTVQAISKYILKANMILWNGPLGAFETSPFEQSSVDVANLIKENNKLLNIPTLVGGGDTISVIKLAKAEEGFSYISTAGGAFLEWLEGKESPGVLALKENNII